MKRYNITVNGKAYDVAVEEVGGSAAAAPVAAAPVAAAPAVPAPAAAPVADGTKEMVADVIGQFKNGSLTVFKGDYIGVDTDNPNDIIDLSEGFVENKDSSAPSFNYILKDIITIE